MFKILANNYELFVGLRSNTFMRISMNPSYNNLHAKMVCGYMLKERTVPLTHYNSNVIRSNHLRSVGLNLVEFEQHLFLVDGTDKLCIKLTEQEYLTLEYTNQLNELNIVLDWFLPPITIHYIKDFKLYSTSPLAEQHHIKNLLLSPTTFQLAKIMLYESNTFI